MQSSTGDASGETERIDAFCSPANASFYNSRPYHALNEARKEIRLIKVHAGSSEEPITCELVQNVAFSQDSLDYQAVSYVAGDPNVTLPIFVNGLPFNAFLGVGQVLRSVRRIHQESLEKDQAESLPLLWIDQIAINQNDASERAAQVSMMRDVYRGASRVRIWLGGDENDQGEGLQLLDKLFDFHVSMAYAKVQPGSSELPSTEEHQKLFSDVARIIVRSALTNEVGEAFRRGWNGLRTLLRSPWWSRCWIVQELLCGKERTVQYGRFLTDWDHFDVGFHIAQKVYSKLASSFHADEVDTTAADSFWVRDFSWEASNSLLRFKRDWERDENIDIKVVLDQLRDSKSTDPRDKIYSILGLVRDDYRIAPDYSDSKTMQDVLSDVINVILKVDNSLEFLRFVETDRNADSGPTWLPHWTTRPDDLGHPLIRTMFGQAALTLRLNEWRRKQYSAAGTTPLEPDAAPYSPHPGMLCIEGLILGPVADADTIGEVEDLPTTLDPLTERWRKIAACGAIRISDDTISAMLAELLGEDLMDRADQDRQRQISHILAAGEGGESIDETLHSQVSMEIWSSIGQRRFFCSPSGYVGLLPATARPEHLLCVLFGCSVPCVLMSSGSEYQFVGTAYVHGLMHGEALAMLEQGLLKRESLTLV